MISSQPYKCSRKRNSHRFLKTKLLSFFLLLLGLRTFLRAAVLCAHPPGRSHHTTSQPSCPWPSEALASRLFPGPKGAPATAQTAARLPGGHSLAFPRLQTSTRQLNNIIQKSDNAFINHHHAPGPTDTVKGYIYRSGGKGLPWKFGDGR